MAKIIKADGTEIEVQPDEGKKFSLKLMQQIVGGYIQIIKMPNSQSMIVNEEGLLKQLPINAKADLLCPRNVYKLSIVGDVLICKSSEVF